MISYAMSCVYCAWYPHPIQSLTNHAIFVGSRITYTAMRFIVSLAFGLLTTVGGAAMVASRRRPIAMILRT